MKSSIFDFSNSKIWRISALKVYLKLNQKVVRITLSTYDKPSLNMQKIGSNCPIFNFKTFRAEILQIFELLIWKIDDFINSFWLYLTFRKTTRKKSFEWWISRKTPSLCVRPWGSVARLLLVWSRGQRGRVECMVWAFMKT